MLEKRIKDDYSPLFDTEIPSDPKSLALLAAQRSPPLVCFEGPLPAHTCFHLLKSIKFL
jgi:hypothetical protein